jgi:glycerophosphoryl diester phosphodiesterase
LAVLAEATEDPLEKVNQLGFQPQVLSPDHTVVNPALIQAVHARHLQIIPWTVNDPVRAQELRSWGVDGLITDYPDRI